MTPNHKLIKPATETANSKTLNCILVFCITIFTHLIISNQSITTLAQLQARANNYSSSSCTGKTAHLWEFFENEQCTRANSLPKHLIDFTKPREPTAWRWKYMDEYDTDKATVLLREKSLDERLANIIYTAGASKTRFESMRFNSGDSKLDLETKSLLAGSRVNDNLCGQELQQMLDLLEDLETKLEFKRQSLHDKNNSDTSVPLLASHIMLARVLDSFGRYDSGHLSGRTHTLGAYDQCLKSRLLLDNKHVELRFCWAQLSLDKHLDPELAARRKSVFEKQDLVLSSGICIPESCHTKSFKQNRHLLQKLIDSQYKLPKSLYLDETLPLDSIYCLIDNDSRYGLPLVGKLLVAALVGWISLAIYATIQRGKFPNSNSMSQETEVSSSSNSTIITSNSNNNSETIDRQAKQQQQTKSLLAALMDCLNLNESWEDFIDNNKKKLVHDETTRRVELDSMNPIKILGTAYVVLGHVVLHQWNGSMNYILAASIYDTDRVLIPMMVGTFIVDTFFVITGMLLAYHIMKRLIKQDSIEESKEKLMPAQTIVRDSKLCLQFITIRYLRLMPLYLLFAWFKKNVVIYLGFGPYWDYGFDRETVIGSCKHTEGWLDPLSPLNAYVPTSRRCVPQGWSVSADLFFTFVAIPISVIIARKHQLGLCLAVIISIVSVKLAQDAFNEAKPSAMWEVNEMNARSFGYMLNELSYLYTGPHYRLGSILTGVIAGYILICYEQQKFFKWPIWFKGPLTKLAIFLTIWPFISAALTVEVKQLLYPNHHSLYPSLNTICRFIWAISNAILLMRMATDWKDNALFRAGRSKFWKILVKLNYAILLIHIDIMMLSMNEPTSARLFTKGRAFLDFAGIYSISLLISILIYVVIENPLDKIIRRLTFPSKT